MKKLHCVIYLPGLGDDKHGLAQTRLLKFWKIYGLDVHYHFIGWADKESFEPKLERIISSIDNYSKNNKVSLVGTSAGASAALNAYAVRKNKIRSVVCICGKLQNPKTMRAAVFKQNPAFKDSLDLLPASFSKLSLADRNRILSAHPIKDRIVPPSDTLVEGTHTALLPTFGHGPSILYALTLGGFGLAKFINRSH